MNPFARLLRWLVVRSPEYHRVSALLFQRERECAALRAALTELETAYMLKQISPVLSL